MPRIAHASFAALSCALFVGCSSGDSSSDKPAQLAEAGAGSGAQAGSSGRVSAGGSGGHTAGHAGMAAAAGGGSVGQAGGKASAGAGGSHAGAPAAGSGGQAAATADVSRAMIAADAAPMVADADYAAFIEHLNQFGLDLGQNQAASNKLTDKNGVYSPLSASYALAMTYAGARGKTAEEMKKVLGDSFADGIFHRSANKLARELAERVHSRTDDGVTFKVELNLADALFVENTLSLGQSFLETLSRDYDSGVHRVDFKHAFEPARMQINDWVAGQTHDRIQDLLPPGAVDDSTRVVLVNALYFYGSWRTAFNTRGTSEAPFHTLSGSTVQVKTMHHQLQLPYASGTDYALVELPYDGDQLHMTVVLPAQGKFDSVRAQLSAAWLKSATASVASKTVSLALPRWKLTTDSFSLKQGLQDLGMKSAFAGADLSGISQDEPLVISDVLQKAFIAVDEAGTEAAAAAATAVTVVGTSLPAEVIAFTVDRPFLFFIRDQNGVVLFSGQLVDPSQAAP